MLSSMRVIPRDKQLTRTTTKFLFCDLHRIYEDPNGFTVNRHFVSNLKGWGLPGFDGKWDLKKLVALRREADFGTKVVLWTNRPDYKEMRDEVEQIAHASGVIWYRIILRPIWKYAEEHEFKLSVVKSFASGYGDISVQVEDHPVMKSLVETTWKTQD